MIKPDVIVSWPRNTDYPKWRQYIRDNRQKFEDVIIVFTETNEGYNFRDFVKEAMQEDDVIILETPEVFAGQDWRDVAVNKALLYSTSEWVWFTEQDFFPLDGFWEWVENYQPDNLNVIGVYDGSRLHPCSLFITRELLHSLKKNFGIVPDLLDHFGLIQKQIDESSIPVGIIPSKHYLHMAGLSHNMRLVVEGGKPNHQVEQFYSYINECMNITAPLPTEYVQLFNNLITASHREKSA